MIIYISGKYSGSIAENIKEARKVAIEVWESGHVALCPHLNTAHFEEDCKLEYDDYIKGDLILLERCDAILMLEGWEESQGAQIELQYAEKLGLPVYYYPDIPKERDIFEHARQLVYGVRNKDYGHPAKDFECSATIFKAHIKNKYGVDIPLDATDIPIFMQGVKISREGNRHKYDNILDGIGYWATLHRIYDEK